MTTEPKTVTMDRDGIHKKLDEWFDELTRVAPSAEDGEMLVFKLTGYCAGYSDDDGPVFGFELESRRVETGL